MESQLGFKRRALNENMINMVCFTENRSFQIYLSYASENYNIILKMQRDQKVILKVQFYLNGIFGLGFE